MQLKMAARFVRPLLWAGLLLAYFTFATSSDQLTKPLTPDEWNAKYECPLARALNHNASLGVLARDEKLANIRRLVPWYKRTWFSLMDECNREQVAWRFSYLDELLDGFHQLIKDRSSDERLANVIYSTSINGAVDLSYFTFNSGDPREDLSNLLRVAGPRVNDSECARDLAEMAGQFRELISKLESMRADSTQALDEHQVRLARVLDSFGRYGSGTLGGLSRAVGSHNQCTGTHLLGRGSEPSNQIEMRYCWAKFSVEKNLNKYIRERQRLEIERMEVIIAAGICLPASCHSRNLVPHLPIVQELANSQFEFPRSIYLNSSLELESVFCLVDEDSQFTMPASGKLCIAFASAWLAFCCLVTVARRGSRDSTTGLHEEVGQVKARHMNTALGTLATDNKPARWGDTSGEPQASDSKRQLDSVLACFDLALSWRDFTADKRHLDLTGRVELDALNPIKIFCCAFAIAAHSAIMSGAVASKLAEVAAFIERDLVIQAALLASVVVDTFFVISGMLLTFITLRKLSAGFGFGNGGERESSTGCAQLALDTGTHQTNEKSRVASKTQSFLLNWLVLAANRYLRLVPLYALMWWFRRDVLIYLGSGPFWDFGLNKETVNGACVRESWLMPFTPLSAFRSLSKQCYLTTWSVSNDIFFCLLLPPFILMLKQKPRQAIYAMAVLIATCALTSLYHYAEFTTPESRWELSEMRLHGVLQLLTGLSQVYTWPIYRLPSFFIGALAGHALFRFDKSSGQPSWPRWLAGPATWAASSYLVGHVIISGFSIPIKNAIYPYQRLLIAYYTTFDRTLWAAANAVLFLRMVTDWRQSALMRSFASQRWRTIARLNFASIFIHWIFVIVQINSITLLPDFTYWQIYSTFVSIFLMTMPAAALVHIVFENPTDKLIKKKLFGL